MARASVSTSTPAAPARAEPARILAVAPLVKHRRLAGSACRGRSAAIRAKAADIARPAIRLRRPARACAATDEEVGDHGDRRYAASAGGLRGHGQHGGLVVAAREQPVQCSGTGPTISASATSSARPGEPAPKAGTPAACRRASARESAGGWHHRSEHGARAVEGRRLRGAAGAEHPPPDHGEGKPQQAQQGGRETNAGQQAAQSAPTASVVRPQPRQRGAAGCRARRGRPGECAAPGSEARVRATTIAADVRHAKTPRSRASERNK